MGLFLLHFEIDGEEVKLETGEGLSMADKKREPTAYGKANLRKARELWTILRLIGMRKIRESADERRDRNGVHMQLKKISKIWRRRTRDRIVTDSGHLFVRRWKPVQVGQIHA